jgi:hypothetical protein
MVKRGRPTPGGSPSGCPCRGDFYSMLLMVAILLLTIVFAGRDYKLSNRLDRLEKDNMLQQQIITDLGDKLHGMATGQKP